MYCKLPTNGKQLPAFPLEPVRGSNPGLRGGRRVYSFLEFVLFMVCTCFIVSVPLVVYSGLVLICISSHDFFIFDYVIHIV